MAKRPTGKSGKARRKPITIGKRVDRKADRAKTTQATKRQNPRKNRTRGKAAKSSFWGLLLRKTAYYSFILGIWGFLAGLVVLAIFASDLPDTSKIWEVERQPSIAFYDQNGALIATRGAAYAPPVTLSQMPPFLPDAVLSVEDRRFYGHFGIDPLGLMRAAWVNFRAGHIVQGGSTLTQQLAKNLFLSPERTYRRKIQEVLLALWLEQRFTKDEILSLYLNRVYFGRGAWGVEAASMAYFNKPAAKLSLGESAMIAGLLKAPNRYSPTSDIGRAERRATIVLDVMVKNNKISDDERAHAFATPIRVRPVNATPSASYFVDWLAPQVRQIVGEVKTDLVVQTTLNLAAQRAAERAIGKHLTDEAARIKAGQGALLAIDGQGAVQAMAGGKSYAQSQFNRATQARRQPGSAFKPFVYLAALENGLSPWTIREDAPVHIGDWSPTNYKDEFAGEMTLQQALARSINTIAVQLAEETGRWQVASVARRMGLTSPIASTRSMSLGSNETSLLALTTAYAPFANGGYLADSFGMTRINVREGPVLWERKHIPPALVIDDYVNEQMNMMLQGVVLEGTGRGARISSRKVAGKTGTTNDFRDAWFVGFTGGRTAGVWVGDDKNRAMDHVTGGGLPTRIWHDFMAEWLQMVPVVPITLPEADNAPAEKQAQLPTPILAPEQPEDNADPPAQKDELGDLLTSLSEKLD